MFEFDNLPFQPDDVEITKRHRDSGNGRRSGDGDDADDNGSADDEVRVLIDGERYSAFDDDSGGGRRDANGATRDSHASRVSQGILGPYTGGAMRGTEAYVGKGGDMKRQRSSTRIRSPLPPALFNDIRRW